MKKKSGGELVVNKSVAGEPSSPKTVVSLQQRVPSQGSKSKITARAPVDSQTKRKQVNLEGKASRLSTFVRGSRALFTEKI